MYGVARRTSTPNVWQLVRSTATTRLLCSYCNRNGVVKSGNQKDEISLSYLKRPFTSAAYITAPTPL